MFVISFLPRPTPMYPPSYMEPGMGWEHTVNIQLWFVWAQKSFKEPLFIYNVPVFNISVKLLVADVIVFLLRVWESHRSGSVCRVLSAHVFRFRRPTPYGNQTDYRIYELNKRLQNWTEVRVTSSPTERAMRSPHQTGAAQKHSIWFLFSSWLWLQSVGLHCAAPVNYFSYFPYQLLLVSLTLLWI